MYKKGRGINMLKISEFQMKDVVNVSNGRKMGHIADLEINLTTGRIDAVIIPGAGRMMGFLGRDNDIVIPWKDIVKIGKDVILVRFMDQGENSNEYIQNGASYKRRSEND
jgi:YlmC/YmxH family sporulation protein